MMMVLDKNVLTLKRSGDTGDVPFNLRHFYIWQYDPARDPDDLLVSEAADDGLSSFGAVLERFVRRLPPEAGFFDRAGRYVAETERGNGAQAQP